MRRSSVSNWISGSVLGQLQRYHISRETWKGLCIKKKKPLQRQPLVEMAGGPRKSLQRLILKMNLTLTWHWKMKMELVRHFLPGRCHWLGTASEERPHSREKFLSMLTGNTKCSYSNVASGSHSPKGAITLSKMLERRVFWVHSSSFVP